MKAVVYARTSTLDQAREEKVSIPHQIAWAKEECLKRGWEFVNEFIEPGIFGDTEAESRVAFSNLLTDARRNKFEMVLIYHSSRFAREADIGMRMCRLLGQQRIQTYFRNATIEPVSPESFYWGTNIGSMYLTAFSFIGDFKENVDRSERVRSGFQGLAERGVLTFAPYGYKKVPQIITDSEGRQRYIWNYEIDTPKALVVQRIFTQYTKDGGSLRQIMIELNKELIPSPSGKVGAEAWSTTTIRNILNDPAYIGLVRWGRKLGGKYLQGKSSSGKQKRVITADDKWTLKKSTNHQGFIEEHIFSRVHEKLRLRGALKGRAVASKGLLTGVVFCGKCGKKAYFKTSKGGSGRAGARQDYVCSSYFTHKSCQRHVMSSNKLHTIIISRLDELVNDKSKQDLILGQEYHNPHSNIQQQLVLLRKEEKDLTTRQQRVLMAYESGTISLKEFGEAKTRLDSQALQAQTEVAKLDKVLSDQSHALESQKKFVKLLSHFKEEFPSGDFTKQKELLANLIGSVIVRGDNIQILYRL